MNKDYTVIRDEHGQIIAVHFSEVMTRLEFKKQFPREYEKYKKKYPDHCPDEE